MPDDFILLLENESTMLVIKNHPFRFWLTHVVQQDNSGILRNPSQSDINKKLRKLCEYATFCWPEFSHNKGKIFDSVLISENVS